MKLHDVVKPVPAPDGTIPLGWDRGMVTATNFVTHNDVGEWWVEITWDGPNQEKTYHNADDPDIMVIGP